MKRERHHRLKAPRDFELEQWLIWAVAAEFSVSRDDLLSQSRGTQEASRARGIIMYILHTVMEYSMTSAGCCVGRDRTTVRHQCALIEDLRSKPVWDAKVEAVEEALKEFLHSRHQKS